MAIAVGHGTTITFNSGFFLHFTDVDWSGMSRGSVETTDMATTGGQTFIPEANYTPGTLEISGIVDMAVLGSDVIPINAAAETCTVAFAGSGSTYAASAFMTDFSINAADKSEVTYSATLTFSGTITGL